MAFRIGFGYDVHQLAKGRPLIIGGVAIPHGSGLSGHSDADVLIHAICDALLGAAGLEDIGHHFPDTDQQFKNIDSTLLLRKVCSLLEEYQYKISNIDSTLCLEKPKISSYIPLMKNALANAMNIDPANISIKATTNEKMGFIGKEKGAVAYAVALIEKV